MGLLVFPNSDETQKFSGSAASLNGCGMVEECSPHLFSYATSPTKITLNLRASNDSAPYFLTHEMFRLLKYPKNARFSRAVPEGLGDASDFQPVLKYLFATSCRR